VTDFYTTQTYAMCIVYCGHSIHLDQKYFKRRSQADLYLLDVLNFFVWDFSVFSSVDLLQSVTFMSFYAAGAYILRIEPLNFMIIYLGI